MSMVEEWQFDSQGAGKLLMVALEGKKQRQVDSEEDADRAHVCYDTVPQAKGVEYPVVVLADELTSVHTSRTRCQAPSGAATPQELAKPCITRRV